MARARMSVVSMRSCVRTPRSSTQRTSGMATSFTAQSTYTRQSPKTVRSESFASAEPMISMAIGLVRLPT